MLLERERARIRRAAAVIHEGFVNYNNNFRRITQRARGRFEQRDWAGGRNDLAGNGRLNVLNALRVLREM